MSQYAVSVASRVRRESGGGQLSNCSDDRTPCRTGAPTLGRGLTFTGVDGCVADGIAACGARCWIVPDRVGRRAEADGAGQPRA